MQQLWCDGALRTENLMVCRSWWQQLVGRHAYPLNWMGVVMLPTSVGVHTFLMRIPMTGVWLSASFVSLGSVSLRPNKVYLAPEGSVGILETSGDALAAIREGAQLSIRAVL
ncbi:MAG: hypothetical protein ACKO14_08495 [Armatimonadota bacterium]